VNTAAAFVALTSAACFALASVLHFKAAHQEPTHRAMDPRLLARLLRRPLWLVAWIPDFAGTGLQTVALAVGALALVQPILVSGLFLAVPLDAVLDRRRPEARDLTPVAISTVGLAILLVAAQPRAGVADPSLMAWLGIGLGTGTLVGACLVLARRSTDTVRGTVLGIASGALYAATAALLKACTARLAAGPLALLTNWRLYALVFIGLIGLILNQNAFQSSSLVAPLTALTLADPALSVVIAATAFHEQLHVTGPRLVLELAAVLAMARGIWLVTTIHPLSHNPGGRT
jgi:hypothetical protein